MQTSIQPPLAAAAPAASTSSFAVASQALVNSGMSVFPVAQAATSSVQFYSNPNRMRLNSCS